jgi:hypothetical protein
MTAALGAVCFETSHGEAGSPVRAAAMEPERGYATSRATGLHAVLLSAVQHEALWDSPSAGAVSVSTGDEEAGRSNVVKGPASSPASCSSLRCGDPAADGEDVATVSEEAAEVTSAAGNKHSNSRSSSSSKHFL